MPEDDEPGSFTRILVAVDGSENSRRAARIAVELAGKYGAELHVLHVVPRLTYKFIPVSLTARAIRPTGYGQFYVEARKEAEKYVGDVVSMAQSEGVEAGGEVLENTPSIVEAIIVYATRKNADLVVMGTKGRSGFTKLLTGSVSNGVVTHAHCPVLIVR